MWQILVGVMLMMSMRALPEQDARLTEVGHLNLRYPLPSYRSIGEWQKRAEGLRLQVQIACGLFPSLSKTSLNPRRIVCYEDEDIMVERVAFESFPNFFVTGNLYLPKKGERPYPAVLHPHGHVPQLEGRLYERERLRAMAMAKLGFVVFAYDMVGYGDQFQADHRAAETPQEHLWAISKGGVQTWNSLRALDFLVSLPEVDKNRIGCCGSSGGGTQTFLLTAVDDRLAVSVPAKMVSAHMQGGCICENPPLLRIEATNPEITALAVPRPLLLISDDGDWTKETPSYEFPFVQSIYRLLGVGDRSANAHFTEGHDFAQGSREAYYSWMARWLKKGSKGVTYKVKEPPMQVPEAQQFHVWDDNLPKPNNAITWNELVRWLTDRAKAALEQMYPRDAKALKRFQETMCVALQRTLAVSVPTKEQIIVEQGEKIKRNNLTLQKLCLGRKGAGDRIPGVLIYDAASSKEWRGRLSEKKARGFKRRGEVVLLVSQSGAVSEIWSGSGETFVLSRELAIHFPVIAIDTFLTGTAAGERKRDISFFTTYNRTDDAERAQDIVTTLAFLQSRYKRVHVVGLGNAGLWVLLARAVTKGDGKTALDWANFDADSDEEFMQRLYVPCLRRLGDVRTALVLMSPRPLLVHNAQAVFPRDWAELAYRLSGAAGKLKCHYRLLSIERLADWLTK